MKNIILFFLTLIIGISHGQTKKNKSLSKKVGTTTKVNTVSEKKYELKDPSNDISVSPIGDDTLYMKDEDENKIYNIAGIEVLPDFPGGTKNLFLFISKNFQFTDEMKKNELKGKIIASFVIEKDGSISIVKIIRGLGFGSEKEAERVLKLMPKWAPGIQNGKKVRCSYILPIAIYATK